MSHILSIIQVIVSVMLIACILIQHRTSGLSATFGGGGAVYVQRRGAEKVIFKLTVWLSVVFFVLSLVQLVVAGS